MSEKVLAWHFLNTDRRTGFGENILVRKGQTLKLDAAPMGGIGIGRYGYHASVEPMDALAYMRGTTIERVELGGEIIDGYSVMCATERTCLGIADAEDALFNFAAWCIEQKGVTVDYWFIATKELNGVLMEYPTNDLVNKLVHIICQALDVVINAAVVELKTAHDAATKTEEAIHIEQRRTYKRYMELYDEFVVGGSIEANSFELDAAHELHQKQSAIYYLARDNAKIARNCYYDALDEAKMQNNELFNRKLESLLLDLVN